MLPEQYNLEIQVVTIQVFLLDDCIALIYWVKNHGVIPEPPGLEG